mgnify:CR=1 FL=1
MTHFNPDMLSIARNFRGLSQTELIAGTVAYRHLRAHETRGNIVCLILLETHTTRLDTSPRHREQSGTPMPSSGKQQNKNI